MKNLQFYLLVFILSFTACSKDDKNINDTKDFLTSTVWNEKKETNQGLQSCTFYFALDYKCIYERKYDVFYTTTSDFKYKIDGNNIEIFTISNNKIGSGNIDGSKMYLTILEEELTLTKIR